MKKQKKINYLYKTTCLITNRYYIGIHSTEYLEDGYMGSGKRLRASIRKYGKENHKKEILDFFENRNLLILAEIKAITEDMIIDNNCMNLMGGGSGGFVSDEHYINMGKLASMHQIEKWKDPEYREKRIKESSERMTQHHKNGKINYNTFEGRKHTDESKKKMSESSKGIGKGNKNSQYGTCWITKDNINKKIKKEDIEIFLKEGWIKGREMYQKHGDKF